MNKLSFLLLLLASTQSFGSGLKLEAWQNAAVKVRSFPCASRSPMFEGSGLAIRSGNKVSILTSEHVVIHSKEKTNCHAITLNNGTTLNAKLERYSFASGLATLSLVEASSGLNAVSVDQLSSKVSSQNLVALGYPRNSEALQTLKNGQLVSETSHRALIPEVSYSIEAAQLPVEFSMSGGLLLYQQSENTYSFAGILSSQILKRNPSTGTYVEVLAADARTRAGDLTLAIPADFAMQWLKKEDGKLEWTRDPKAQLQGQEVVTLGALSFSMKKSTASDTFGIGGLASGGADGSGIGGADSSGIGGSDASGIGGNATQLNETLNSVEIQFIGNATAQIKSLNYNNALLNLWRDIILRHQKVQIPFLRNTKEARLVPIHSLSQFLSFAFKKDFQAVTLKSYEDKEGREFKNQFKELILLSQSLRENTSDNQLKSWLGLIRDQSILAQNSLINSSQLEQLLIEEHDSMWQIYYAEHFDEAVALATQLKKVTELMKQIGL